MKTVAFGKAEVVGGAYDIREGITLLVEADGTLKVSFWYDGGVSGDVELTLTHAELLHVLGPNVEVRRL